MIKLDRRLILNFDWTLFSLVLIISGIGLLNIYSAGFSLTDLRPTPYYIRQIQWILVGSVGMALAFLIDYRFLNRHAYLIYAVSVALLLIVAATGYATRGSQRWIALGGFTFQPSELVKLTLILALTKYFDRHRIGRGYYLRELFIPFLLLLIPFLFILKQPDLGTALILLILFLSMVFFIGLDWRSLLIAAGAGLTLAPIGWFILKDYQKERIMTFFSPEKDPLGSGYHIIQSMIAVGSGGILGKGFLKGSQTQLKFLPEQQTDFIFSVFAEEWGFLGAIILLVLFMLLILWGLMIIARSKDFPGALIAFGITMLIFWEVFINIGMVLGILPVVGIPLPFLSYGGSSMVVLMTAVGLLMNISVRRFILQS
ncbi:MAG: rod shape-determining protein RodA [Deltaproteobacteria bacterium]|nr:rod shape-determining protein RodA [Deltaproteobacteria bacterium]